MKRSSHSAKTPGLMLLILCAVLICAVSCPSPSVAEEAHPDDSQSVRVAKKRLGNVWLNKIAENTMVIDGKQYIVTDQTKFYKKGHDKVYAVRISKIAPPCLVDITYKTYSVYTETSPFHPGERVLSSVLVKGGHPELLPLPPIAEIKGAKKEVGP